MAHYADQISTLPLLNQLRASTGRDDVSAAEVEQLVAMVLDTADAVGPLLDRIPLTFKQYTQHDLRHSNNLIYLMGKFIPVVTMERLNAVELTILALSAIVHDAGMFVTDQEKDETVKSEQYRRFEAAQGDRAALLTKAREAGEHLRAATLQDALLAEYFRRLHPQRPAAVVTPLLKGKLDFRGTDLLPAVLRVSESHGWGVLESNDPRNPDHAVSRLRTLKPVSSAPVNEQYLACCLRLADIMDFDRSRTPAAVYQHLEFTEQKSWEEWNKHLQIVGWHVTEHEVMYSAECTHPAFYVAVMEFLDWIDAELRDCRHLVKDASKAIAERYELHLPPIVDRRQIEMKDKTYLTGAFRFQLDYERIMQLLMDRSLYPDPSLFLRELLQNALDACRTREAHAKNKGISYEARIAVWDHAGDPDDPRIVIQDNGIGMSQRIVENYFMRVGRSYYTSAEFALERQQLSEAGVELQATSQFGIGILSCFMVADRFEVETYRDGHQPLHITIEGPMKYFTIRLLPQPEGALPPVNDAADGPPRRSGTRIIVHLHPGSDIDVVAVLEQFAVNVEYSIHIYDSNKTAPQIVKAFRWRDDNLNPSEHGTEVMVSGRQYGSTEVGSVLDKLLVAVPVPLASYDFATHLSGQAWFWLLRGTNNEPCVTRGYLTIGRGVGYSSLAGFVAALSELKNSRALAEATPKTTFNNLLRQIVSGIRSGTNPFTDQDLPLPMDIRHLNRYQYWNFYYRCWEELAEEERAVVRTCLTKSTSLSRPWFTDVTLAEELLEGNLRWAQEGRDLGPAIDSLTSTEEFAIHGIKLSAGIAYWNPMTGAGKRETLLTGPTGLAIDIRGRTGVKLAANRLFVDSRDAEKVVVPLLRAIIQHGICLACSTEEHKLQWRSWFGELVVPLFNNRWRSELRRLELRRVEQNMEYLCKIGSDRIVLSREEVISKFGTQVPTSWLGHGDGVEMFEPVNNLLIRGMDLIRVENRGQRFLDFG